MIGNTLLDSVIAQAQQRNAQFQAQNQARLASIPTSTAIANPVLDNIAGGGDPLAPSTPYSPMSNQQQYDTAAKFVSTPLAARALMPGGMMMTAAANYAMNQAAKDPSVKVDLAVGDPMAPKGFKGWARAQKDNPQLRSEINQSWNAMRAKFMAAEAKAEQDKADIEAMGGFGGVQKGMTAANFGVTADDVAAAVSGGDDGGDYSFGGAGEDAVGGGYGDAGYSGEDFGGYA